MFEDGYFRLSGLVDLFSLINNNNNNKFNIRLFIRLDRLRYACLINAAAKSNRVLLQQNHILLNRILTIIISYG